MTGKFVWEELSLSNTSAKFNDWEYRNITLAVVVQCAHLVNTLAHSGRADEAQIKACIDPLLVIDSDSVADIYPDVSRFSNGLSILQKSLDSDGMREFGEPMKYVLGMSVLQQQLMRVPEMQAAIRQRMQQRDTLFLDREEQDLDADSLMSVQKSDNYDYAVLAALYQDTISKLTYRIHVKGNVEHLRNQRVADQIRALLLAGIRSALLWHQLGGRRWHLFFYKRRIRDSVAAIRRNLFAIH